MIFKNYAETTPFNDAIWVQFSEQQQHQSIKCTIFNVLVVLFWCKKDVELTQIFFVNIKNYDEKYSYYEP